VHSYCVSKPTLCSGEYSQSQSDLFLWRDCCRIRIRPAFPLPANVPEPTPTAQTSPRSTPETLSEQLNVPIPVPNQFSDPLITSGHLTAFYPN
jgi:hypothetical protein